MNTAIRQSVSVCLYHAPITQQQRILEIWILHNTNRKSDAESHTHRWLA